MKRNTTDLPNRNRQTKRIALLVMPVIVLAVWGFSQARKTRSSEGRLVPVKGNSTGTSKNRSNEAIMPFHVWPPLRFEKEKTKKKSLTADSEIPEKKQPQFFT